MTEVRPEKGAWAIVALLFLFMMINFADKAIIGLAGVPIMTELNLTPKQFGLVGSSFFLLFSISAVVTGFIVNRVQSKWVLLVMGLVWSLVQFPMLGTVGIELLIACRIVLGAGEGPAYPVALHAAYKWFPDEKRAIPERHHCAGKRDRRRHRDSDTERDHHELQLALCLRRTWRRRSRLGRRLGAPWQGRPHRRAGGRRGCSCRRAHSLSRSAAEPHQSGVLVRLFRRLFRSRAGAVLVHPVSREGTWLRAGRRGQADRVAFHRRLLCRARRQLAVAAHDAGGINEPGRLEVSSAALPFVSAALLCLPRPMRRMWRRRSP